MDTTDLISTETSAKNTLTFMDKIPCSEKNALS